MAQTLTADDVRSLLRDATNGNQAEWAKANGVTGQYVSDILRGRREPGWAVLRALSIERRTLYEGAKKAARYSPSDIDLAHPHNVIQAQHELQRATTDAQFATWARKWGERAIDRIHNPDISDADVVSLRHENTEFEDTNRRLTGWIEDAIADLEAAWDDDLTKSDVREKINEVIKLLEKAIAQ